MTASAGRSPGASWPARPRLAPERSRPPADRVARPRPGEAHGGRI